MAISITKAVIGGDENTWGTKTNNCLDTIVAAVNGTSGTIAPDLTTLTINGTDVTTTAAELNVVDGSTAATSTTVVGGDRVVFNDNGTMKQVSMSDIATYTSSQVSPPTVNNSTITISAGNALTGGGNFTTDQSSNETITINHSDTSTQSSVNNSGSTFIQDITLDTYGHITNINSANVSTALAAAGTLVGYGAGTGLNGDGNATLKANTSYLFYAPNNTFSGVYIYQNNSLNDRLVNGGTSTLYIYANGGTQRTGVGMGGVSGGNPGPHLVFELT